MTKRLCFGSMLLGLISLFGCKQTTDEPIQDDDVTLIQEAYLTILTSGEDDQGTTIDAVGEDQRTRITVRSFAANGELNLSPTMATISLLNPDDVQTSGRGVLSATETGAGQKQLEVTNREGHPGLFDAFFGCDPTDAGNVLIEARHGELVRRVEFACIAEYGDILIEMEDGGACDKINSEEGGAPCPIVLRTYVDGDNGFDYPQVPLTVSVEDITGAIRSGVSVSGNKNFMATSAEASLFDLESEVSLTTNDDGTTTLWIFAPENKLEQTATFIVSGQSPDSNRDVISISREISFEERDDQSRIEMSLNQVSTGDITPVSVRVSVINSFGELASSARVIFESNDSNGVFYIEGEDPSSGTAVRELEIEDGRGELMFLPGRLPEGVTSRTVEITGRYQAPGVVGDLTDKVELEVVESGRLLIDAQFVDVNLGPGETPLLFSDQGDSIRLRVAGSRDNVPVDDGSTIRAQINRDAQQGVQIVVEDPADCLVFQTAVDGGTQWCSEALFETQNGEAVVQVSAINRLFIGRALVELTLVDVNPPQDLEAQVFTERAIDFTRDPVLRSIEFIGYGDEVLGVIGSSETEFPNQTIACYGVINDAGEPMDVNALSDIRFELPPNTPPGVTFLELSSDNLGEICAVLNAGTQTGPISLTAIAVQDDIEVQATSEAIPVVSPVPVYSKSLLSCDEPDLITQRVPGADQINCQVLLVNRDGNRVGGAEVQFRSEGGSVPQSGSEPSTTNTQGELGFAFGFAGEPQGATDVRGWSVASLIPNLVSDMDVSESFFDVQDAEHCFDYNSGPQSRCNMLALCDVPGNEFVCPLAPSIDDVSDYCWHDGPMMPLAVIDVLYPDTYVPHGCHISPTSPAPGDTVTVSCSGEDDLTFSLESGYRLSSQEYAPLDAPLREVIESFAQTKYRCGHNLTCLLGLDDALPQRDENADERDACLISSGCFDFNPQTYCPENGLHQIVASVKGEESPADNNGDNTFTFDDLNENGRHDIGEPSPFDETWVDLPEPFLDKANTCTYLNLKDTERAESGASGVVDRYSDDFTDAQGNVPCGNEFGFPDENDPNIQYETSRTWDYNGNLFFNTHIIGNEGGTLLLGIPCDSSDALTDEDGNPLGDPSQEVGRVYCPNTNETSRCINVGDYGVAPDCASAYQIADEEIVRQSVLLDDGRYSAGQTSAIVSIFAMDSNGNCWNASGAASLTTTLEAPLVNTAISNIPVDDNYCHFSENGNGVKDPLRPWCQFYPALGVSPEYQTLTPNCGESKVAKFTVSVKDSSQELFTSIGVDVRCGECGDGYITGAEECDPFGTEKAVQVLCSHVLEEGEEILDESGCFAGASGTKWIKRFVDPTGCNTQCKYED